MAEYGDIVALPGIKLFVQNSSNYNQVVQVQYGTGGLGEIHRFLGLPSQVAKPVI